MTWYQGGTCATYTATPLGKHPLPLWDCSKADTCFTQRQVQASRSAQAREPAECLDRSLLAEVGSLVPSRFVIPYHAYIVGWECIANCNKAIDGYLAYAGSSTFYASATPPFDTQETVYTTTNNVQVKFMWQAK
jgi:hypothetical protein